MKSQILPDSERTSVSPFKPIAININTGCFIAEKTCIEISCSHRTCCPIKQRGSCIRTPAGIKTFSSYSFYNWLLLPRWKPGLQLLWISCAGGQCQRRTKMWEMGSTLNWDRKKTPVNDLSVSISKWRQTGGPKPATAAAAGYRRQQIPSVLDAVHTPSRANKNQTFWIHDCEGFWKLINTAAWTWITSMFITITPSTHTYRHTQIKQQFHRGQDEEPVLE